MNTTTGILVGLLMLIVGVGVGYGVGQRNNPLPEDMHIMPDGSMMHHGDHQMDMAQMMRDMNAELRGKTGDELDLAFIDEMIIHHEGAVEMAEILLEGTEREELINLAHEIIDAQTDEIDMMRQWRVEWFGQ